MVSQLVVIDESLVVAIGSPLLALVIPVIQVVCWCELSDGHCRSMVAFVNSVAALCQGK